jgi:hypothetical protein
MWHNDAGICARYHPSNYLHIELVLCNTVRPRRAILAMTKQTDRWQNSSGVDRREFQTGEKNKTDRVEPWLDGTWTKEARPAMPVECPAFIGY